MWAWAGCYTRDVAARFPLDHRLLLGLLVVIPACAEPGFGVGLRVETDEEVSDSLLAAVSRLRVVSTGDEATSSSVALDRTLAREERLIYRPSRTTSRLVLSVFAEDGDGAVLASGESPELDSPPRS